MVDISSTRGDRKTKALVVVVSAMLMPGIGFAAPVEKLYYVGESKLSDPSGKVYGSQVILLEKTLDPDNGVFVESAVVVKPDRTARNSPWTTRSAAIPSRFPTGGARSRARASGFASEQCGRDGTGALPMR
jgi:hypothetical protein